jgi:hypothetical protein
MYGEESQPQRDEYDKGAREIVNDPRRGVPVESVEDRQRREEEVAEALRDLDIATGRPKEKPENK